MKKFIYIFMSLAFLTVAFVIPNTNIATTSANAEILPYRAVYMIDYNTGTVLCDENSDTRYPIASMVKIMTLNIAFDEICANNMKFDEKICISDYAAGMGGSQMFLDAHNEYAVCDLLKGVIICSANDAATALGERISGDIGSFVNRMNAYAKELGMNNTLFCNATGLPNSGEQYSTAKDVTIMMRKLLTHPKYFEFSKIWMEDYTHPSGRVTEMTNTNRLIRMMSECDAGKTGYTDEAGFCLSASAKLNNTRVVATLLGASDSKTRFKKVSEMFRYAFGKYETKILVKKGEIIPCEIEIKKAKEMPLEIYCDSDITYFGEKNNDSNYTLQFDFYDDLTAPIDKNTPLGEIKVLDDNGQTISSGKLFCTTNIPQMTYFDCLKNLIKHWFICKKY